MRITSQQLQRTRYSLSATHLPRTWSQLRSRPRTASLARRLLIHGQRSFSREVHMSERLFDDTPTERFQQRPKIKKRKGTDPVIHNGVSEKASGSQSNTHSVDHLRMSETERRDPKTWVRLLDGHIPRELWQDTNNRTVFRQRDPGQISDEVLKIVHLAGKSYNADTDILTYMIMNSRRQAALWICEALLTKLVAKVPATPPDSPPSNILWPAIPLSQMAGKDINVDTATRLSYKDPEVWESRNQDPRYSTTMSDTKDSTMARIWFTLGSLVIRSADLAEEEAVKVMNAVQLILGQVHGHNLVPNDVYSYPTLDHTGIVQRSPIVHLLSSRILTALSDAAWRDQQEENIQRAASHGLSYEEIGRNPPGGRYRLKVRPMGPEIWLEFILWCCVDGGYALTGQRLIYMLQSNTQNPWFAITWSDRNGTGKGSPQIDWDRVRSRTGGTVGRLEGYSKGQPLAEVPPRTVSTEVVLALVEAQVNTVRVAEGCHGAGLDVTQHAIVKLLSFLEPHDLPLSYFDYLGARLLMTESFDTQKSTDPQSRSKSMKQWSDSLMHLKSLATIRQPSPPKISFRLNALVAHSEFTAGVMHQVLDSFVQQENIHAALTVFNDLQKLVDNSKLHAIGAFLQHSYSAERDFFSSRGSRGNLEFVDSHGQLPLYKLGGLLNLAIDSNLVGFGQWLLFNDDPDGPLIPKSAYSNSAVAGSLVRFAALSNDVHLWPSVSSPRRFPYRLPSVNFLRTSFNARVSLLDIEGAAKNLKQLNRAQGGGYGLSNLAHLAGTVLKLESNMKSSRSTELTYRMVGMLHEMLVGRYDSRGGVLQRSVRTTFRQQVSQLLSVFESFTQSSLAKFAEQHRDRFRATNIPSLSVSVFNTFLESVVEVQGAIGGKQLVDRFCALSVQELSADGMLPGGPAGDEDDGSDMETGEGISDRQRRSQSSDLSAQVFIPFASEQAPNSTSMVVRTEKSTAELRSGSRSSPRMTLDRLNSNQQEETVFPSPYFSSTGQDVSQKTQSSEDLSEAEATGGGPVTTFNARTIRLIVRKAIRDRPGKDKTNLARQRQHAHEEFQQYQSILRWARRKFVELGFTSTMIEYEIKDHVAETSLATLDEELQSRGPKTTVRRVAQGRSRVSETFGIKHTRVNRELPE